MATEPDKFWAVTFDGKTTFVEERTDSTLIKPNCDAAIFKNREQANQFCEAEIRHCEDLDWPEAGSEDCKRIGRLLEHQAVAVHPLCWKDYRLSAPSTAVQMTDTCRWLCIMCGLEYGPLDSGDGCTELFCTDCKDDSLRDEATKAWIAAKGYAPGEAKGQPAGPNPEWPPNFPWKHNRTVASKCN